MLDCVDIKNKLFMHISSGQKKIIMIIRSLMINPSVLLFDELTNGLDIKSKFLVYDSINKIINQNNDLVIFWATHSLAELDDWCSRVIMLDRGSIEEDISSEKVDNFTNYFTQKLSL